MRTPTGRRVQVEGVIRCRAVLTEFSARDVTLKVLTQLERRRDEVAFDPEKALAAVDEALAPVKKDYQDAELPAAYWKALEDEVRRTVLARWHKLAGEFTTRERAQFGLWRGGDPV